MPAVGYHRRLAGAGGATVQPYRAGAEGQLRDCQRRAADRPDEAGLAGQSAGSGDIDVSRDFLDVQDVLSAYLRLLSHGEAGAVYNVCSGQEQKIRELIELLADIAQVELEIVQDPARMRRAEQRRVRGSHARLHDTTGWKPEITIKQSLRAILSDWESRVREE